MDPLAWLLDSDPAIRWQALRDLSDASPAAVAAERARVAHEGLGARILECQAPNGAWHNAEEPEWLPTLFTLQLLRATGVDPRAAVVQAALDRLESGFRWAAELGGKPFFEGETEPCINGGALALGAYFDRPSLSLATRLLDEQLADGGWNCEAPKSRCSSFHTTICVLEGLLELERRVGSSTELTTARRRGEEYLRRRHLFRRLSTGTVVDPRFLELSYPPRYRYDVLRALDYFRGTGEAFDVRSMSEARALLEQKRTPAGRWLLEGTHDEALAFPFPETVGEPSRWNTLRALRVLRWVVGATSQRFAGTTQRNPSGSGPSASNACGSCGAT